MTFCLKHLSVLLVGPEHLAVVPEEKGMENVLCGDISLNKKYQV